MKIFLKNKKGEFPIEEVLKILLAVILLLALIMFFFYLKTGSFNIFERIIHGLRFGG